MPRVPKKKEFTPKDERDRVRKLWPAGHRSAMDRMKNFVNNINTYAATRSNPAKDSTSRMSAYISAGVVSVREILQSVKEKNGSAKFSSSPADKGIYVWAREIVFCECYRQSKYICALTIIFSMVKMSASVLPTTCQLCWTLLIPR